VTSAVGRFLRALPRRSCCARGWTLAAIGELLLSLPDTAIEAHILSEANGAAAASWLGPPGTTTSIPIGDYKQRRNEDLAEETVILLAQGILRQYDRTLSDEIVRQDDTISPEMHAAMCRLGSLYIREGKEDRGACVHDVLDRARRSLETSDWGLNIFQDPSFRFRQAVLIDSVFKVPTPDCSTIANITGTFGEDNLLESRFHTRLRETAERCGNQRDRAYTAIRELLARRSLITEGEFVDWLVKNRFTPLQQAILDEFYQPVPELWFIRGCAHRCAHCGTLMRPHADKDRFPDGCCPIRQCNGKHTALVADRLDPMLRLYIAKAQILTYWTGPAIDELTIYEAALKRGLQVELYPERDLCDVSINGRAIGIDAKSYSSPVSLALRLNRNIGGLINYRRRIIAIGEELIDLHPNYLASFCRETHKPFSC